MRVFTVRPGKRIMEQRLLRDHPPKGFGTYLSIQGVAVHQVEPVSRAYPSQRFKKQVAHAEPALSIQVFHQSPPKTVQSRSGSADRLLVAKKFCQPRITG